MRLMHLADLHIGKRVNEFSMIEDQRYILDEILKIAESERPDAVLIAGDVYDKAVPPAEAVELLDDFLVRLSKLGLSVFVISGNHDSPERIAFGGRIMKESHVYMSPVYDGNSKKVTLTDSFGNVNFYLLPFIKPSVVRRFFPDTEINDYTDAVSAAVKNMDVDKKERNVIITHQFVTGSERSESEELSIGGTDNVDVSCFDAFDYVALGHLHRPQKCKRETVRYSGTPLKYSFSEARDKKSAAIVELREKGDIEIKLVPLKAKRDLREVKGSFDEVSRGENYTEDYIRVILTDENDILDALGKLRRVYPNLMRLDYDNERTRSLQNDVSAPVNVKEKTPMELFSEFYSVRTGKEMSREQEEVIEKLIEKIWGEN